MWFMSSRKSIYRSRIPSFATLHLREKCDRMHLSVERTDQLRAALCEFVSRVEHSPNPQLRVAVDAYMEQAERLLTLADEALRTGSMADAEILMISAQRWVWKIAKNCALSEERDDRVGATA